MDHPTRRLDNLSEEQSADQSIHEQDTRSSRHACLRCGQPMISAKIEGDFTLRPDRKLLRERPPAFSFCKVLVCTECGYTELKATDPKRLK